MANDPHPLQGPADAADADADADGVTTVQYISEADRQSVRFSDTGERGTASNVQVFLSSIRGSRNSGRVTPVDSATMDAALGRGSLPIAPPPTSARPSSTRIPSRHSSLVRGMSAHPGLPVLEEIFADRKTAPSSLGLYRAALEPEPAPATLNSMEEDDLDQGLDHETLDH